MYFRRKMDSILDDWLKKENKLPALIMGIRQCGKTETIREFAKRNNLKLIECNFWNHPELKKVFEGNLEVKNLISNLSLEFSGIEINNKETLLFFDEIQECPRARLSLKSFSQDAKCNVIASGSYLGINGYIIGDATPIPVGYEDIYHMKTMDFEEFLWALGYKDEHINILLNYFEKKEEIPSNIHNLFNNLFHKYICIGGFPKVMSEYVSTENIALAFKTLNSVVYQLQNDFGRRVDKNGNPVFNPSEISRIQDVYNLIPTFLSKENKRFIVSKISTGTQYDKNDAIEYLRQAHIVNKVYNLSTPSLPLVGEKIFSQFKLFPEDIGIVTSMYGIDTIKALNQGNLGQGKGAIYEALVFDSLNKAGIDTFYFAKETGLKIDFVICYKGYATLIEAKAKTGNTKSSKTLMKHPEHYGKTKLIKIGDYNVSEDGDIITIPHYLTFALGKVKYDF